MNEGILDPQDSATTSGVPIWGQASGSRVAVKQSGDTSSQVCGGGRGGADYGNIINMKQPQHTIIGRCGGGPYSPALASRTCSELLGLWLSDRQGTTLARTDACNINTVACNINTVACNINSREFASPAR